MPLFSLPYNFSPCLFAILIKNPYGWSIHESLTHVDVLRSVYDDIKESAFTRRFARKLISCALVLFFAYALVCMSATR